MRFEYVIRDNQLRRIVSYGCGEASEEVAFGMTKNTWLNAMKDMFREILRGTPFRTQAHLLHVSIE